MRAHWEWAGRHAMFWIFVTLIIFGGFFLLFDYVGADDSVRTQCLVLLGTITVVKYHLAGGGLAGRTHRADAPYERWSGQPRFALYDSDLPRCPHSGR
jgi:hypothetical protein